MSQITKESRNDENNNKNYNIEFYTTIDDFIDNSLNSLNEEIKQKHVKIDKIADVVKKFISQLDYTLIDSYISNQSALKNIKNTIESYYYIYMLLLLSFDNPINKIRSIILEYNKNDKIGNFELSTFNMSLIIEKIQLINNFCEIINNNKNPQKIPNLYKSEYDEARYLYDMFEPEEHVYFTKGIPEYKHNIIRTIIFLKIYQQNDRTKIFKIIENEELSKSEETIIEVVDSIVDEIDYATIEKLFLNNKFKKGVAEFMYEMLIEYDELDTRMTTTDKKINDLINSNVVIPITDEFLRYHKDSEKYEKNIGTSKIDIKEKTTKKDNTKIRYIVTKINKLMDYNNILEKGNKSDIEEVNKLIYPSLVYRKAVIINELEELSIINKIINQGKRAMDNNEYYADLMSFRTYPYINFRDYKNYGFNFKFDNTVETIRYCNFEFKDPNNYPTQYKSKLQVRVAPKEHNVNIVGVVINPIKFNDSKKKSVSSCFKLMDTVDIGKDRNGFTTTINLLKKQINDEFTYNKMPYWIFDKNQDKIKMKSYENLLYFNTDEYFKLLLSKIYDELVSLTYEKIITKINELPQPKLYIIKNVLNGVQNSLINIYNTSFYNDILINIFYNKLSLKGIPVYDTKENLIPGLNTKLIKIPTYVETARKPAKILIKKQELLIGKREEETDELLESSYCQHQVTWNVINSYKKKDPNRFNQELFKFIKKYVTDNKDGEHICKSCYQFIDVKKYMHDSFSSNLSNVALSVPLEAELENIPEYEKYNKAIKNMDKNVEKLAYISGIHYYLGNNLSNKYRRQDIVKYTIDLVTLQFQNFDTSNINMKKERLESSNKLYGIDKEKSNYFIFEMDNNLFTYSSKDTDKYKRYKNNNIYAYMIFLTICELSVGQIVQFNYDKLINYVIFDKFAHTIFDGIKIRINNGNDIHNITNYKLLCYVIYYMSSMIIKYNLWFIDIKNPTKSNTINPQMQKIVIHTILDLINSILEINAKKEKSYIYEYIATKFFIKLNTVYDNKISKESIERLLSISDKKIEIVNNKIKIRSKDPNLILSLETKHVENTFGYNKSKVLPGKYFIKSYVNDTTIYELFGSSLNDIVNKQYHNTLNKIYSYFIDGGVKRQISISDIKEDTKILEKHANKIIKFFVNKTRKYAEQQKNRLLAIETELIESEKYQQEFIKKALALGDITSVVDTVIDLMEKVIGSNININNRNIYLKKTVYIIDHDHLGNSKPENLVFTDTENKIEFKKNEQFFKTDVYYYIDRARNITIFYHGYDLYLLGYKEMNRDYVVLKNTSRYLKINHSIRNKLLLLGHSKINYYIDDEIKIKHNKMINFTEDIIRYRINNLKNIIKEFQMIIYQIKNKHGSSDPNSLVKQYSDKFKELKYYDDEGCRIFEEWKLIIDSVYFIPLKSNVNIEVVGNILNANKLLKLNNNDNILLYYLCQQIQAFINVNNDQYNKSKLVYLLANIINQLFNQNNVMETIYMNNEVRKFNMLLTNVTFDSVDVEIFDIDEDKYDEEKLTDEQKQKLENEIDDLNETNDGMDIDLDNDMETTDDTDEGMEMIQAEGRD
jgi:hypothetical protein